jgi:glucose/arabinose dehydrogenase/PKD repeat protein
MLNSLVRRVWLPFITLALLAVLLVVFFGTTSVSEATTPPEFSDVKVVAASDNTNVANPTSLDFTPDGRMLITTQTGNLMVFQNGALVPTPALSFPSSKLCFNSERGLLGVAVDPAFAANRYIYLYYTFNRFNNNCPTDSTTSPVNRVSRFVLQDNNTVSFASETVLLTNIPSLNGNHNGGDLHFGADGYLYISVGDSGCKMKSEGSGDTSLCAGDNSNARSLSILSGKILRIMTDGSIPPGNPLASNPSGVRCGNPANSGIYLGTGHCQEMFAWGLRNPFRFSFKPGTNQFNINDVGQGTWEEIDQGLINADYGWNIREGHCGNGLVEPCSPNPAGLTPPIYDYPHTTGCDSITGGAFVPSGVWPSAFDNIYLYADYVCGKIFKLAPPTGGSTTYTATEFASNLGGLTTLRFGPYNNTQALYYLTYTGGCNGGFCGQVRRIAFTNAPTAVISANPTAGLAPLTVNFSGAASSSPPSGGTITSYIWDFKDGSAVITTSVATTSHVYTVPGTYFPTLKVRNTVGATSDLVSIRIDPGNSPPVPTISVPANGSTFAVGQNITLTGSAADQQDGTEPPSRLFWQVLLHHLSTPNTTGAVDCSSLTGHFHPYFGPTSGNNLGFTAPAPEDLDAVNCSYLEIILTAFDAQGLSGSTSIRINPRQVQITFAANPSGATIAVNGNSFTGSRTYLSWEGYQLFAQALTQPATGGGFWVLQNWSDNNNFASRVISTPASPATYTANFSTETCNPSGITTADMTDNNCGSLPYAFAHSPGGDEVTIQSGIGPFVLTDTLTIPNSLTIQGAEGTCGVTAPLFQPDVAMAATSKPGIVLTNGAGLKRVTIAGFGGVQLKAGPGGGNRIGQCVQVSKT